MKADIEGTGLIIFVNDKFLFTLSKEKYWGVENNFTKIAYTSVGGRVERGEAPEVTVRREAKEEIGCEIKIIPSNSVLLIDKKGRTRKIQRRVSYVAEYYVEYPGKPGEPSAPGKFLSKVYVFLARLIGTPFPRSEIPGLIYLTERLIEKSLLTPLRLESILSEGGVLVKNREIPKNSLLYPMFTPEIIGKAIHGKFSTLFPDEFSE